MRRGTTTRVIAHRELRHRSGEVLREVLGGESFESTNHGDVVALLVPPARAAGGRLRVRPARRRGGFSELARTRLDHPLQQALDDMRGDR